MIKTFLLAAMAVAMVVALPFMATAYGAAHVGYTHVGPGGVYHTGRTAVYGPGVAYYGSRTGAYR
jgi:hypothetical protein